MLRCAAAVPRDERSWDPSGRHCLWVRFKPQEMVTNAVKLALSMYPVYATKQISCQTRNYQPVHGVGFSHVRLRECGRDVDIV